ncbi:MAG: hypothetical protein ACKOXB_04915 [Flavobacteriales bacterium]
MEPENIVLIKGGSSSDIKKALQQWINLYAKHIPLNTQFELYKNESNHLIKVRGTLSNDYFFYLVNYLAYPEEIQYHVEVAGYTTGDRKTKLENKSLLVYLSKNDTDFDNVLAVTPENKHYKIDFGGNITEEKESISYVKPEVNELGQPEILKCDNTHPEGKKW